MEETSRDGSSGDGMASFEGKYPDSLLNKSFVIGEQTVGYVVKDARDTVVVFGDGAEGKNRYDIPKSEIVNEGGDITLRDVSSLQRYRQDRDAELPEDQSLRPSAEQIRQSANTDDLRANAAGESPIKTTPEVTLEEAKELTRSPRDATTTVSMPEGYEEPEQPEILLHIKSALYDLKRLLDVGSKVAINKSREAKERMEQKRAETDAAKISDMGDLAAQFNSGYEDLLNDINSRSYAEQAKIYDGLITLIDYQRELAVARRDMALRFRDAATGGTSGNTELNSAAQFDLGSDISHQDSAA